MRRGRNKKIKMNEQPAALLTIEQLVTELTSRPDFIGAVTWQTPAEWQWRSQNCNAGLVFLQLSTQLLTKQFSGPQASQPQQP